MSTHFKQATSIQTSGQSGNIFSGHSNDFAGLWADLNSIQIPWTGAVDPEGVWRLRPGG
ncbi:MAG: hypothetical protein U1A06_03600 [Hoeflea sp.]|nr:hypothetical protein [Hoeflea sp.]